MNAHDALRTLIMRLEYLDKANLSAYDDHTSPPIRAGLLLAIDDAKRLLHTIDQGEGIASSGNRSAVR
ncbi:hypothetical protein [Saccharopolyspora griseoalba]|uniref:Uncharacterized protein n=1 Tax=Saccharopolyspora griseoalba TaxID=1431848 RepID=A0ABW2LSX3_9PSEU